MKVPRRGCTTCACLSAVAQRPRLGRRARDCTKHPLSCAFRKVGARVAPSVGGCSPVPLNRLVPRARLSRGHALAPARKNEEGKGVGATRGGEEDAAYADEVEAGRRGSEEGREPGNQAGQSRTVSAAASETPARLLAPPGGQRGREGSRNNTYSLAGQRGP